MNNLGIYVRGLAMGAADIVPGVSGGTIALITGIYDRFIDSLKNVGSIATFHHIRKGEFKALAQRVDLTFLLSLFAGIFTSILGLASAITYLLQHYPHPVWAFFLGLVLASALIMFMRLKREGPLRGTSYGMLVFGIVIALALGRLTPQDFEVQHWHFFVGGAIAICAMILPGISGSFLLLMMGLYGAVLNAIHTMAVVPLLLFAGGCGIGLLSFSHVLSWCLHRFPQGSHALLIGLMLGAVEKLWPWKEVVATRVKSNGDIVPLLEKVITPMQYEVLYQQNPSIGICLLTFGIAFLCILVVGRQDSFKSNE